MVCLPLVGTPLDFGRAICLFVACQKLFAAASSAFFEVTGGYPNRCSDLVSLLWLL